MNEDQSQVTQMPPGDPKASLGFSNMLREHLLTMENPPQEDTQSTDTIETPQTPQTPQEPTDIKGEITGLEDRIMKELNTLKEDIATQGDSKKELADLKTQIEAILNE